MRLVQNSRPINIRRGKTERRPSIEYAACLCADGAAGLEKTGMLFMLVDGTKFFDKSYGVKRANVLLSSFGSVVKDLIDLKANISR